MQCYVLYITEHFIVVLQTYVRDACSSNLGRVARCTYRRFALIYPLSSLECLLQFHNPYSHTDRRFVVGRTSVLHSGGRGSEFVPEPVQENSGIVTILN
jgi:hypothetical protein